MPIGRIAVTGKKTSMHSIFVNGMGCASQSAFNARDWTLAQFYFHVMTAYSILRKEGTDLGKADYVAHMLPYLRPESIPKG